ncbi:MAG TPA: DUF3987 domain-containing protein, partial [Blastocatellia bacterium]|nr:DUF3987 domain-containing protein [Blastocatellia bacterium]
GLLLGSASGSLVNVDLDCAEARRLAPHILPATPMRSGRKSAPDSHLWYVADIPATVQFRDPELKSDDTRAMLVELRSTGGQTVVAPSIHPCGEVYEWQGALEPASVEAEKLRTGVSKLAACALLARYWREGQREQTALAVAGWLLRAGWPATSVSKFIGLAAEAANDDEAGKRQKAVADTAEKLQMGESVTGFPSLAEMLGERVAKKIAEWLRVQSAAIVTAEATGGWPDPQPLPEGLRPVRPLPANLIPEPFRDWLSDISRRMQCPLEYPTVAAVIALAAVVGNAFAIRPKRRDDWTVVPNLWGAIIGLPSLLKTPALMEAMKPLNRLDALAREEYAGDRQRWELDKAETEARVKAVKEHMARALRKSPYADTAAFREQLAEVGRKADGPVERRYVCNDPTLEKLGELLNENPRGLLLYRDELTGWLRSLDKRGHESDRAFFLESWTGTGSFTYDRIGRGTIRINTVTVSILGGIQPGPLSQYLRGAIAGRGADDGFVQRFQLLVYPDPPRSWANVDCYPDAGAKERAFEIFRRLDRLDPISCGAQLEEGSRPFLRFTGEAQEFFDQWREDLERSLIAMRAEDHPAAQAHFGKYRSLMPSLALLFELVDAVGGGECPAEKGVGLRAAQLAAAWCSLLEEHARRVYGMALEADAHLARVLADHLRKGHLPDSFTARDVARKQWAGMPTVREALGPLDLLEALDWLRPAVIRHGQEGGRPRTVYE